MTPEPRKHLFHEDTFKIYSSITEASNELERRRNDKELMKKISEFFSALPLDDLSYPRAFLSRPIGTPNFELRSFLVQSEMIDLDPVVLEYPGKLVAKNDDKYHDCILHFRDGFDKDHNHRISKVKAVDISKFEGKPMASAKTSFDGSIMEMHHKLLFAEFPKLKGSVVDFTGWFNDSREATDSYYFHYLSLFVCHGILFDNFFFNDDEENKFIIAKFMPSFERVVKHFGVRPLIVPLLPLDHERSNHWLYYPASVKEDLRAFYGV